MIGKQLDLFGGPPMPPKKIRVEEEEISPSIPDPQPPETNREVPDSISEPEIQNHVSSAGESEIFVQLPGPPMESLIVTMGEIDNILENIEIPGEDHEEILGDSIIDPAINDDVEDVTHFEAESISDINEDSETEDHADIDLQEEIEEVFANDVAPEVEDEAFEDHKVSEPDEELIMDRFTPEIQESFPAEKDFDNNNTLELTTEEVDDEIQSGEAKQKTEIQSQGLNIPEDNILNSRQYYTMRETAAMFNVNQSLLRFWENEFDVLKPKKNRKGDRYFRPEDIRNLEMIYHLLRVRKFTIEGAKEYIKSRSRSLETFEMVQRLEKLKLFLQELKTVI